MPRLERDVPAGVSLIGWDGLPTTSDQVLTAHPGIERLWAIDAGGNWILDAPGLPPGVRASFDIARGTGLVVVTSVPVMLRMPLPADRVELFAPSNGGRVVVQAGTSIDLYLAGNPTTGFTWEVAGGVNGVVTQPADASFIPSSGLIGAGGTMVFPFVASQTGETTLNLVYRRPFEPGRGAAANLRHWRVGGGTCFRADRDLDGDHAGGGFGRDHHGDGDRRVLDGSQC